jgi:cell division protein FtsZ
MEINLYAIGIGGAGCNMITRLTAKKTPDLNLTTIAMNTDFNHLKIVKADKKIFLDTYYRGLVGHGTGGNPELGERAISLNREKILKEIDNPHIIFIAAGMGGGTGSGGAPELARLLKSAFPEAIIIGVATYPFKFERGRLKIAVQGIEKFKNYCNTLILIDNNKLLEYYPNLPISHAFSVADAVMIKAILGIASALSKASELNIDYADIRSLMGKGGLAMIAIGEGKDRDKVEQSIESTLSHPLLDIDYTGAKGAIVHIESSQDLTIEEGTKIAEELTKGVLTSGEVKLGLRINPELKSTIYVTLFIVGISSPQILGSDDLDRLIYDRY